MVTAFFALDDAFSRPGLARVAELVEDSCGAAAEGEAEGEDEDVLKAEEQGSGVLCLLRGIREEGMRIDAALSQASFSRLPVSGAGIHVPIVRHETVIEQKMWYL
jgi:hypothetical protein